MTVDKKLMSELETLARIRLDDNQKDSFLKDLNEIINYADTLGTIGDESVADCPAVTTDLLRDDDAEIHGESTDENKSFTVPKTVL